MGVLGLVDIAQSGSIGAGRDSTECVSVCVGAGRDSKEWLRWWWQR